MKNIFVILVLFLLSIISQGQDIVMTTEYAQSEEVQDLLSFENIDYYKIKFSGESLVGKNYMLISKEIWNGSIAKTDTLVNSFENDRIDIISDDSLSFKVFSRLTSDNFLKMNFSFPRFSVDRKFKATDSEDYSLRDQGVNEKIFVGKKFYALAYILPYEVGEMKMWCAVEESGKDIEKWGEEFNLEHYMIFEMMFQ